MKILKLLLVVFVICTAALLAFFFYLDSPVSPGSRTRRFVIRSGESAQQIAQNLREEDLIRNETYFLIVARMSKQSSALRAGLFEISASMTTRQIVDHLATTNGLPREIRLTIPEGFTAADVADRMQSVGLCNSSTFMDVVDNFEDYGIDLRGVEADSLEGFLFPETYFIDETADCKGTARRMVDLFFKHFGPKERRLAGSLGLTTLEAVTLASLIEMEAQLDSERARISGVLYNRLKRGMLLQCDASVQYALSERKKRLLYKDLEIDSPYNTYLYKGLPPGPICNPGAGSLRAALRPEKTDYLYYVARRDGSGSHVFSRSNAEHNRAKNRIKREMKKR